MATAAYRSSAQPPSQAQDRLGLPPLPRLVVATSLCSLTTFALGALSSGKRCAHQFLAENAHRLPRTHQGWYFYHKTKNYRVAFGAIKGGVRYACRAAGWTGLYVSSEALLDWARGGTMDAGNSALAALATAGLFSYKNGFSRQLTRRTMRLSGLAGLTAGLLQDVVTTHKGGRIWYIEGIKRQLGRPGQHAAEQAQ
ncbi:hypothetical protein BCR37DRAFT_376472 [Protomyces lactucae-debilis]|uniref:Tim17/Tim22/Tim23/Pmp24 family-domain-containing protein n=1 Tax=Protomyces lactucae-debilis TaxID=2754530 RepID=A0A1Y2FV80_PROLT|nr:uncharacterized protein BCR37DRAFT_376472 [Protomyces lactucae-debilis]ORY87086.1 hypothetical protein BCR37DRAFT_376472 [Protomyces lactucae-debilis]